MKIFVGFFGVSEEKIICFRDLLNFSGSELIEIFATYSQLIIIKSFESQPSKYYLNLNQISRPPETPRATKECTHVKF